MYARNWWRSSEWQSDVLSGIMPIPGAKSLTQLDDLIGSLDWELETNEVEMINEKFNSL